MNRGDVHWVKFDPQVGSEIKKRRPAVIVSINTLNKYRRTVIVVPLTSAVEVDDMPLFVRTQIGNSAGAAVVDQLKCVDKKRVGSRIAAVDAATIKKIDESLRAVLSL